VTAPATPASAVEIWSVLLEQAAEDDAFEAAARATDALTDAQVADELRLAGFDVAELHDAALALLAGSAPPHNPEPVQAVAQVVALPSLDGLDSTRRRRPAVLWLAAAATTATVGGGLLYATLHSPSPPAPVPAPSPPPSAPAPVVSAPPDLVAARDLRARARDALAMGYATQCLDLLDQAKAIDPAGDEAADVAALRRQATAPTVPVSPKPRLR
jgi:hypothetical protein